MMMSFLVYVASLSEQLYFRRICFFTVTLLLIQSTQIFRVTIFIQELPFSNSCFFRAATFLEQQLFQIGHLFSEVIFFRIGTFQSETSTEDLTIMNRQLFKTATFLKDELVQNKDIYRRATFLKYVFFLNKFFKTVAFSTKLILKRRTLRTALLPEKVLTGNR